MEQEITLNLTVAEINVILGALGQMPYAQVAKLINDIKIQAQPQLPPVAPPGVEVATEEEAA